MEICAGGLGKAYKGEGKHRGSFEGVVHCVLAAIKPLHMLAFTPDRCCVLLCEGYVEFLAV